MEIIEKRVDDLFPYGRNPRHNDVAVEAVANSIKEFGFKVPIVVDSHNVIIAGHTRLKAAKQLELETVPCIIADDLTEEQVKAFRLADNKVGEIAMWDLDLLTMELESIDIDMTEFGFELSEMQIEDDFPEEDTGGEKYTNKVNIPQYEITGKQPSLKELTDVSKQNELIREIENAAIPDDEKEFLKLAASRHTVFDYGKIAEYYAHADKTMQELMEKSALVIIDIDDAIKYGFAKLTERFEQIEVLDSEE